MAALTGQVEQTRRDLETATVAAAVQRTHAEKLESKVDGSVVCTCISRFCSGGQQRCRDTSTRALAARLVHTLAQPTPPPSSSPQIAGLEGSLAASVAESSERAQAVARLESSLSAATQELQAAEASAATLSRQVRRCTGAAAPCCAGPPPAAFFV